MAEIDIKAELDVTVEGKTYPLIPVGNIKPRINKKAEISEAEKIARIKADTDLKAINVVDLALDKVDVLSDSAIDIPAIRKKVIDHLGVRNTIRLVLVMNQNGFTGKSNGNLKVVIDWEGKDLKDTRIEINLYDVLKGLIQAGATDMKADAVTTGRIMRAFSGDVSRTHFKNLKTKGPFAGLVTFNSYCWYYGGIYNCGSTFTQLGHFLGMAFALKNKKIPKALPLDFPAGYLARSTPNPSMLVKFILLASYVNDETGESDKFKEIFIKFQTYDASKVDVINKLKDAIVITYVMALGEKWTMMLPVNIRKKYNKELLSDAYAKSAFHTDAVKKATKLAKKAKKEEDTTKEGKEEEAAK